MTNAEKTLTAINALAAQLDEISTDHAKLAGRIPGWSSVYHRLFFKAVFGAVPEIKSVLILGVYLGRDIATMLEVSAQPLQVVGVDKFADTPCDDWPADKRNLSWEAAGFGKAPNAKQALENINPLPPHAVRLIEADDAVWLPNVQGQFDLLYVDTSHDKATVARQLQQVRKLAAPGAIIAGDDYENIEATWGVRDAVVEAFQRHHVLAKTIWFADVEAYK
jgi:SAM-dependent methyltransferase